MDLFCKICDRSIVENESEYYIYLATLRKKKMIKVYIKNILLLMLIWMKLIKY